MEFLENIFTNFIFEKFISHEALVTEELQLPITIKRNFLSSCKLKNCSSDIGSFDYSEANFLPKLVSFLKTFLLNEYDLRIILSVFLIEIFDLRGNELK